MANDDGNRSCLWAAGGCCGCLALIFLLLLVVPVGGGVALFQGLKSTDAYQQAVTAAQQDPRLIEALGSPIETGLLFSGSINTSGSSGEADFSIPLKGPDGRATLYVVAIKTAGRWTFEVLEAEIESSGERFDLRGSLPSRLLPDGDDGSAEGLAVGSEAANEV